LASVFYVSVLMLKIHFVITLLKFAEEPLAPARSSTATLTIIINEMTDVEKNWSQFVNCIVGVRSRRVEWTYHNFGPQALWLVGCGRLALVFLLLTIKFSLDHKQWSCKWNQENGNTPILPTNIPVNLWLYLQIWLWLWLCC